MANSIGFTPHFTCHVYTLIDVFGCKHLANKRNISNLTEPAVF